MQVEPFEMPSTVIIETESGYPINIPLGNVVPPGWAEQNPAVYERIKHHRELAGITIDDNLAPAGKTTPGSFAPNSGPPRRRPALKG